MSGVEEYPFNAFSTPSDLLLRADRLAEVVFEWSVNGTGMSFMLLMRFDALLLEVAVVVMFSLFCCAFSLSDSG